MSYIEMCSKVAQEMVRLVNPLIRHKTDLYILVAYFALCHRFTTPVA